MWLNDGVSCLWIWSTSLTPSKQLHDTFVEISPKVIARYQLRTQKSWWNKSGRNCTLSAFLFHFWRCFHAHSVMVLTKRFFQLSGIEARLFSLIFAWNSSTAPPAPTTTLSFSLAQTFPLEFLGARASHFVSECRISRCTLCRVVTDLPWNSTHTVLCLMLLPMIADYLWEMQVYRNTIHSDCLGYSKRKLPCFRNYLFLFEMLNIPASYVGFRRVFVPQTRKASFGHIAGHKFCVAHVSSPSRFCLMSWTLSS